MKSHINTERVTQILASYGSNSDLWPENERRAALDMINNSSQLRAQWLQAKQLDQVMGIPPHKDIPHPTENTDLLAKILENLPEQEPLVKKRDADNINIATDNTASFVKTTKPRFNNLVFKSMMAASIALVVTAVISFNINGPHIDQPKQLAQTELDQWFWEEITVNANQSNEGSVDLMAMIDFEQLEDFQ